MISRGRRISLTLAGLVVIFCLLEGLFRSSGETVHVIGIERLPPKSSGESWITTATGRERDMTAGPKGVRRLPPPFSRRRPRRSPPLAGLCRPPLLLTMLLGGLWPGASWNFVL